MTTANTINVVAPGRPMARRLKAAELAALEAFVALSRASNARELASCKVDAAHSVGYHDREVGTAIARLAAARAALAAVREAATQRLPR
jgi:hypothetical protein